MAATQSPVRVTKVEGQGAKAVKGGEAVERTSFHPSLFRPILLFVSLLCLIDLYYFVCQLPENA